MRILFCNIAWMDYYKGIILGKDEPKNGGSYVAKYNDAGEQYNFQPVSLTNDNSEYPDGDYCLGFVMTKSTNGQDDNQLNIDKIEGCNALKNETEANDVLVIYCAKYPDSSTNETYVVGWFRHATVYRDYQYIDLSDGYSRYYNAIAKKEDCVLLPRPIRRKSNRWWIPRKRVGTSYGFGQSNVWFAQKSEDNPALKQFLNNIIKQIELYSDENWVDKEMP